MLKKFLLAIILSISLNGFSEDIVDFNGVNDKHIGQCVSYYLDGNGRSFSEILNENDFIRAEKNVPNLGVTTDNIWLKFSVVNNSDLEGVVLHLNNPIIDEAVFYYKNQAGVWDSIRYTQEMGVSLRKYMASSYIFDLELQPQQTNEYYIKVRGLEQSIIPMKVLSQKSLWSEISIMNFLKGTYAGIILIMLLYNLFVYFSVKEKSYLYYVAYVLFVGLTQLSIKGAFTLTEITIDGFQNGKMILFGSLGAMFGLVFTRDFLHTDIHLPKLDKLLRANIIWFFVVIVLVFFNVEVFAFSAMQLGTILSAILIFVTSIKAIQKEVYSAKFFTIAWSILLFGVLIFMAKDFGLIPYNSFTSYSLIGASAIEMSLLSFALADKINILTKEKEDARRSEVKALKRNEKLITEQKVMLEEEVDIRTSELQSANRELQVVLADLKNAQTQLVSQEKMASLGQLTAGIAHEINNPINFVSSNVKPLKMDIEDLIEIINRYDAIVNPDEFEAKKEEIKSFMNEIDYDYVLKEIDQLINGIHDGADRTAEIVKGLKNFSRLDEMESKKANIHDGLDSTLLILVSGNKMEGVTIEKNYDPTIQEIECFPGKLNQVFSNIIANAFQAMEDDENTTNPSITITTRNFEDKVEISFKDNGPGIPKKSIDKIFEPFYTTKDVGEGTGLGLSIVFSIIEAHNGKIEVTSNPPNGTEFLITLPKVLEQNG